MAQITVKVLVSGVHAVTGLELRAGEIIEIDEEHFGDAIMERVAAPRAKKEE
jgi:hypothetical protein